MKEVTEFEYLRTISCQQSNMECEVRDRAVKDRQEVGALEL